MGFKDFVNNMVEKQAESNEKIRKNKEKMSESIYNLKNAFNDNSSSEMQVKNQVENATEDNQKLIQEKKALKLQKRQQILENYKAEKQYQEDRLAQLKRDHTPFCPKCHSTSLTYVDKKLSLGRTVVGGVIAGAPGAVLGGLSSKKGKVKCLNCGHTWKI